MDIVVRCRYTLIGKLDGNVPGPARFTVADPVGVVRVTLEEMPPSDLSASATVSIHSEVEVTLSTEAAEALTSAGASGSQERHEELSSITSRGSDAARRVADLLRDGLHHSGVGDPPLSSRFPVWRRWSDEEWMPFPSSVYAHFHGLRITLPLDARGGSVLQQYLDEGFEPFVAVRHLHRAENDRIPWSRWIEATIAAELAIKEYLVRKRPELEAILVELPAPPLGALYGRVLEHYSGFRATKRSALIKGAEVRNRLLHRPRRETIDAEAAADYVQDVRFTIFELLSDLYPEDPVVAELAPHGAHRSAGSSGFARARKRQ